jgi:Arf-GAP/SH3 domain/ANK repeat/PH domain-containing protein
VSIAAVTISNSRRHLLTLSPNAFPAARFIAKRESGDETPIEYIQVWTPKMDL